MIFLLERQCITQRDAQSERPEAVCWPTLSLVAVSSSLLKVRDSKISVQPQPYIPLLVLLFPLSIFFFLLSPAPNF